MNNKILVDSSILIEFEKGTEPDLLEALLVSGYQLYYNATVFSEYMYKLIGILANKSPMAVKESKKIKQVLLTHATKPFLRHFIALSIDEKIIYIALDFMMEYNLLPNDALILASCKYHGLYFFASFDSDFSDVCHKENIVLLRSIADIPKL
jgi:predicted nucleic acid-binding protein